MNDNTHYTYAGFGVRLLATIIDVIIMMLVIFPIMYAIYGDAYFTSESLYLGVIDFLINTVLPFVVYVFMWIKFAGTPGKLIFNLKVLDEKTGNHITPTQGIIRYFGYLVSAVVFCLGYFWVIFDKKNQSWHDKMAKTVVVKAS